MKETIPLSIKFEDGRLEATLPIITVSEANNGGRKAFLYDGKIRYRSESFREKAKRHRNQKGVIFYSLRRFENVLKLPCKIKLTRFAPRKLDKFDNLPMSMKYILDAVCAIITKDYRPGRADDTEEIDVEYDQVSSNHYGIKIEIEM